MNTCSTPDCGQPAVLPMPRDGICACGADFRELGATVYYPKDGNMRRAVFECDRCGLQYHMDARRHPA